MATEYLFSNNATTTLAQSVSATATVLNVASGEGDLFPSPSSGQAFAVTLVDAATGLTNEICYCTSRSGDQLTVTRGCEGTNAIAWSAGDTCANYITADVMESWLQESDLNGYLTKSDAASTYVLKAGDTSTGTQYSSGWFWGGYNAGWGGSTTSGQLRWTVCGVAFGNPGGDVSPKYAGNFCVTDVLNDGGNNESGVNMRGYDSAGTLYNWFFAWNGKVTTPGGVLAFENDLLAYFSAASNSTNVTLTNLQGVNWTASATNSYVQVTGGGISLAVPTVAYTSKQVSDEATLREAADTALQTQIDTKIECPNGNKLIAFKISSVAYVSGGTYIAFPDDGFSGTPVSIVATTNADADMDVMTFNWTSAGFYINIPSETNSQNHPVSIMAVGPA